MQFLDIIFYIVILLMSVVIHEVAHGYAALYFGDRTAKEMGRLTLNPIPHLDMVGSILLPGILAITNAPFMIGWAKPVPYNVDNLTNKKIGTLVVASAGILVNFLIAIIFGLILRFSLPYAPSESFLFIVSTITLINLALGLFNLTPIPPLDGSKIVFSLLPSSFFRFVNFVEQYAIVLFLAFIFFFSGLLYPVLSFLFKLITGIGL
ncbi:MAG: site-2 protease family protein [Candidatus Paceibacterota bacterium]